MGFFYQVGKNLHVLSQLEGVELEMYETVVLPRVLEQVVNCKDAIAQFYLMDCLIQVFQDDFHLHTLESVLGACTQLQGSVDVNTVLAQLMDRLAKYAAASPQVGGEGGRVGGWGGACAFQHDCFSLVSVCVWVCGCVIWFLRVCAQVLPEFLQVDAFGKLSAAVVKASGPPHLPEEWAMGNGQCAWGRV